MAQVHIGPLLSADARLLRYLAALGVMLVIFGMRAALAPVLGNQAPLLPFLLGVMVSAYLGGRGPALLASALTPVLATFWFTDWPHDAPPMQWLAHVTFFLLLAVLTVVIVHALQEAVRRADDWARRAEAAARELRDNDRRKDEFLAMLSHELRNPLTPIRNLAHVLARNPSDATTVKKASDMLARQSEHLAHLVDDLLDVARITHRRIELRRQLLNVGQLIETAVEAVQPTVERRHQVVSIQGSGRDVHVIGDEARLCQVIANLLNNASKFSADGQRILVTVHADADRAHVAVRDEGQGIDAQIMPRLFDLFMQGDRTLDRTHGGLGIGLTIVKHLAEMHGGEVTAFSEGPGKGSEFRISLPRARSPVAGPPVDQVEPGRGRRRVLVVDDSADNRESLRELLRLDGHEVETAQDGPEALLALEAFAADIVLLDVGLPRMDGYMVAHAIRARYGDGPRPKIVALTGYARAEDRQAALRSGFDDHLSKPVKPELLLRVICATHAPITVGE